MSREVREAIERGLPLVALESTVIAHGLPHPLNLETARKLEQIVLDGGAVPATIAVLNGRFCVGLSGEQLEYLARNDNIKKLSRRDLPLAAALGWNGATTVATTVWIAQQAGISVFATGGIGGVHRGELPDVSADLPELARARILIVCSGAKSILDLPATREWLETYGITVIGYGCDEMPAFYTRRSGLPVDVRVDAPEEAAAISSARWELGLEGALLLTVPVPAESEIPAEVMQGFLDQSLDEAARRKIKGRELTPFLLASLARQSDGATLKANIALLENNARVAAQMAQALK
ncbi:MAG TPA: pseudouridine-5'-phosphate glycosidase [Pyrinomonadaceae bacterium]